MEWEAKRVGKIVISWMFYIIVALAACVCGPNGVSAATTKVASEKSVVEEILDILKANGQITQQQYDALLKKARAEERARAAKKSAEKQAESKPIRKKTTKKQASEMHVYWKKGLSFETEDKSFSLDIGGRLMIDWGYIDADQDVEDFFNDPFGSGAEMRRARIKLQGTLYRDLSFKSEWEFAGGGVSLKDMYIRMKSLPYVGSLTIGHTKEPFSLEELTSSNVTTFMERSIPTAFAPGRNIGFLLKNNVFNKRMTWAVGAFRQTNDKGDGFDDNDHYNITARITGIPWSDVTGERFLHLGLSYSHEFMKDGTELRFRARPESHLTDVRFVDTGKIPADGADLFGSEAALLFGPFSVQGEYVHSWINSSDDQDPDFDGFYVYASYILTGEHRSYDAKNGIFKGVKPKANFSLRDHEWGAWELALRYSHLDLDDADIEGGTLDDITVGLNWYLNSNTRFMLNYVRSHLDDVGDANIIQSRFQINF